MANIATYRIEFKIEPETSVKVKRLIKNCVRAAAKDIVNHISFGTDIPVKPPNGTL